jgi:hypothetical protein
MSRALVTARPVPVRNGLRPWLRAVSREVSDARGLDGAAGCEFVDDQIRHADGADQCVVSDPPQTSIGYSERARPAQAELGRGGS